MPNSENNSRDGNDSLGRDNLHKIQQCSYTRLMKEVRLHSDVAHFALTSKSISIDRSRGEQNSRPNLTRYAPSIELSHLNLQDVTRIEVHGELQACLESLSTVGLIFRTVIWALRARQTCCVWSRCNVCSRFQNIRDPCTGSWPRGLRDARRSEGFSE